MGQYYLIVNLNKKEFLCPDILGDGIKLMEFGNSVEGTLLALTVLLADGNGRGGGDLTSGSYQKAMGKWYEDIKKYDQKKRKTKPRQPNCETLMNKLVGSWAGDRIVIAGDYADPRKFLTEKEIKKFQKIYLKKAKPDRHRYLEANTNLYNIAQKLYKDISEDILSVLIDAGEISSETIKRRAEIRPDIIITTK